MKLNFRMFAVTVLSTSLCLVGADVFAKRGQGGGPGRGNNGGGGGGGDTGGDAGACRLLSAIDQGVASCNGLLRLDPLADADVGYKPEGDGWEMVFFDNFNKPGEDSADESRSFAYKTWSSRYPYGDVKVNKPVGDEGWNLNTTGIAPGIGWNYPDGSRNHYPQHQELLTDLGREGPVFSNDGGNLKIGTRRRTGSWTNRLINKRSDTYEGNYLFTGVISSHADPANTQPHGFEFRYGYVEARVKLPKEGNGFRSAVWLYSDNYFYNKYVDSLGLPVPARYEIDFMEYLPNSRSTLNNEECVIPQTDVFGISNNTTIVTHGTVFNTYHFPETDDDRSPDHWTLNNETPYDALRCSILGKDANDPVPEALDFGGQWHTFSLDWTKDSLQFYVDGILVHSVTKNGTPECQKKVNQDYNLTCQADIFDGRMYILASMHMGFQWFEGDTIDLSQFVNPDGSGHGPAMEIDYIKVMQQSPDSSSWCGVGELGQSACGLR